MKVKTSITLSEDVLKAVRKSARPGENRSQTIERLLKTSAAAAVRQAADARDLTILNRHADALNAEADDTLAFQTEP